MRFKSDVIIQQKCHFDSGGFDVCAWDSVTLHKITFPQRDTDEKRGSNPCFVCFSTAPIKNYRYFINGGGWHVKPHSSFVPLSSSLCVSEVTTAKIAFQELRCTHSIPSLKEPPII